jgi:3-hydroxy-9,10-secoandrosta-1,3,5(10)-triene-9,17-dione monooxygenase reductase component
VPVDVETFKEVMGRFATGLAVVTALDGPTPVGFTCQSVVSLSLEPPLVALAPAKTSTSWPRIRRAGAFCVNVLSDSQREVCSRFAQSGGDKFDGLGWSIGDRGSPHLPGSLAWIDCSLELIHEAGDHELVIGRVVGLAAGSGQPLVFYRSKYAELKLEV